MNLGIIGCGWVSEFYGRCISKFSDRCNLAWVVDPDEEKGAQFVRKFGGIAFNQYKNQKADGIIIATPHFLHHKNCIETLGKSRALLVEKPLALTVEECDEIIQARDKTDTKILLGYVNRFREGPQLLKKVIGEGIIGPPLMADFTQFGNQESYIGGWLLKRSTLGGGCLFSSAGHLVDLASWLFGEVEEISASLSKRLLTQMEGEDTALALVQFQDGMVATIRESWCATYPRDWQSITIYGSKGCLEWTYTPQEAVPNWHTCMWNGKLLFRNSISTEIVLHEKSDYFDFDRQFLHFLDCIEGTAEPLCTAEEGKEVIRTIRRAEAKQMQATPRRT